MVIALSKYNNGTNGTAINQLKTLQSEFIGNTISDHTLACYPKYWTWKITVLRYYQCVKCANNIFSIRYFIMTQIVIKMYLISALIVTGGVFWKHL